MISFRHATLAATAAVLATGCARWAPPPPEPSRAPETVVFRFLHDGPEGAEAALVGRLNEDKSLHAILSLPETRRRDGALLDPRSVTVTWNGRELPIYTYYKAPNVALLFVLPGMEIFVEEPEGTLRVEASLLGERSRGLLHESPLTFTSDDMEARAEAAAARLGQGLLFRNAEGEPIEGAWIFGQRREDLVARTGAEGTVLLDAPARSTAPIHYAWSGDHWTERFDPVYQSTVTLIPRTDSRTATLTLRPTCPAGDRVEEGLLLVGDDYFHHWVWGQRARLDLPPQPDVPALLLAPGFEKLPSTVDTLAAEGRVTLQPLD